MRRAIVLVLDSFGIGSAPDAASFGDQGSDTLGHIAAACARGEADTAELMARAKKAEEKRDLANARLHHFELASALIQIAIVLCSAMIITGIVWFAFENRRFQGPQIGDVIAKRQAEIAAAERAVGEK